MATKGAIVTGGGHGIGKEITRVLLKHGYKVAVFDISEKVGTKTAEEFTSQFGSESCVFYKCDVTDSQQLKDCYDRVSSDMGSPSVVVNNAGIADEINWKKMMDVNLKAVIDLTYLAVDKMRKDKGGNGGIIVNVGSGLGLRPCPGLVVYSASKWGVVGFTQSMAASLALAEQDWGISLLTLCPGAADSGMADGWRDVDGAVSPHVPQKGGREVVQTPVHSGMLSPEDVAKGFEKLITDNKNGSVMRVMKSWEENKVLKSGEETVDKNREDVTMGYVQQKWSEVNSD